jgi:hypothetical protein
MSDDDVWYAADNGAQLNSNNGMYLPGRSYPYLKKLEVDRCYEQLAAFTLFGRPNLNEVARLCQVDSSFVARIETERWLHGRILHPDEIRLSHNAAVGPGALTLTTFEEVTLLWLRQQQPYRTLKSYRDMLLYYTGTDVSTSTIERFFLEATPFRANMVKPNLVPIDKFKVENEIKARQFMITFMTLNPEKITFGDQKPLRSQELSNRNVRKDPLTGECPAMITDPDFRNTSNITSFTTINRFKPAPVWFDVHKNMNDAVRIIESTMGALRDYFWDPYDVLVIDNATVHTEELEELLWRERRVFVLFLPTRSPEWNPKELVYALLVRRLSTYPIEVARSRYNSSDVVPLVAKEILQGITRAEVVRMYDHCYKWTKMFANLRMEVDNE